MSKLLFEDKIVVEREERRDYAAGTTEYLYYPKLMTEHGDLVYIRKRNYPDSVLCADNRKVARELGEKTLERLRFKGEVLTHKKKITVKRESIYIPS